MEAILKFDLPEEEAEFRYAQQGRDALLTLWDIDQRCRGILKHGDPSDETAAILKEIRSSIPFELLESLQ